MFWCTHFFYHDMQHQLAERQSMNIVSEILRTLYPSWWRLNFFPLTTRQKWKRQSPKTTSSNCEGWWGCHTGKYGSEMLGFSWAIQICISYFWHGLNKHSEPFCCVFFFGIAYPFERLLLLFFSSVYTLGKVSDPCSAYVHVWRLNPPHSNIHLYVDVFRNAKRTTREHCLQLIAW